MGWLSKKKKIYVSSVTYNLAGDEKDHVKYIPTVVLSKIISNTNFDMSDTLQSALIRGPGMRTRTFARWARESGYSAAIGLQTDRLMGAADIDTEALAQVIPHLPEETVAVDYAEVSGADYSFWADQWMADNHPTEAMDDFELDYKEDINTIFITFADGHSYSFQPVNFDPLAQYLYVSYTLTTIPVPEPALYDPAVIVASAADFPPTTGWDVDSNETTPGTMVLTKTVVVTKSYSDGRPNEVTTTKTPVDTPYFTQEAVYSQTVYDGTGTSGMDELTAQKTLQKNMLHVNKVASTSSTTGSEAIGGVTVTTVTKTTVETLKNEFSYAEGTQKVVTKRWSARKGLIYKYASGNPALDAMFGTTKSTDAYLPFMPVRQNERMISPSYHGAIYNRNIKAYKKAFGTKSKYTDLIKNLNSNRSIKDVDHGFIVFGVAVNTKDNSARKYIYKYFQALLAQGGGGTGYDAWKAKWNLADLRVKAWVSWREAQSNPSSPLFGTPEPEKGVYPAAPTTRVQVYSGAFNYNITVSWNSMNELRGVGLGRPGAKVGQVWWTVGASAEFNEVVYSGGVAGISPATRSSVTITWQDSVNTYRSIRTTGLHHTNIVYKGKGVDEDIGPALADGEVSAFVIPLNEGVFRAMSLVDQTQMSQSISYLVLNSYQVVKQKWYQTGLFKVIIVIGIIVVSVFFPPAGGVGAGILGTAAAVGASLGFVGMMAAIVGAIANALAAMILSQLIMMGATALFGDKVGAIVGAIASIAAVSVGTAYAGGQGFAAGFSNLMSAENLLKLTVAAGNGIAGFIGADTKDIVEDTQKLMDEYSKNKAAIDDIWAENLGTGKVMFDPMQLTDVLEYDSLTPEARDTFLSRTLLTGSEIADMTNSLLSNFASITLSTDLN